MKETVVLSFGRMNPMTNGHEKLADKIKSEALKRKAGAKVVVDARVDESLIGGLVVRVGSVLFDGSLKTKLMRLQLAMKGVG